MFEYNFGKIPARNLIIFSFDNSSLKYSKNRYNCFLGKRLRKIGNAQGKPEISSNKKISRDIVKRFLSLSYNYNY